ncbi:hypothetical protein BS78_07G070500 [Paspalum vaginatum]|nr:hypothetical protein BS78_07G070500 [Paspalum vaginatum]
MEELTGREQRCYCCAWSLGHHRHRIDTIASRHRIELENCWHHTDLAFPYTDPAFLYTDQSPSRGSCHQPRRQVAEQEHRRRRKERGMKEKETEVSLLPPSLQFVNQVRQKRRWGR